MKEENKCIFCKTVEGAFTTREHILPESLGGKNWAILSKGRVCDECQNSFGVRVEKHALSDYPFSFFRTFLGIPTKKKKSPKIEDKLEGVIYGDVREGRIGYEPSKFYENAVLDTQKSQIRLLAHSLDPKKISRFLLKMGIEVIANDGTETVFDQRFDAARRFALKGKKNCTWWYLQYENMQKAAQYITHGISRNEWFENVSLETVLVENENESGEAFHLKLLYLEFIIPLEPRIKPGFTSAEFQEPEYRLIKV